MSITNVYRYRCTTETKNIQEERVPSAGPPTECKNDAGHTIVTNSITLRRVKRTSPDAANEAEKTRTAATFTDAVVLTFEAEGVRYDIDAYCECRSDHSGTRVKIRLQLDGTNQNVVDWNPDDGGQVGWGPNKFTRRIMLTAGQRTLRLQFGSSSGGNQVRVRRRRIRVTRVRQET
jgi:hypothetical protein